MDYVKYSILGALISGLLIVSVYAERLWQQIQYNILGTELNRLQVDYWNSVIAFWQPAIYVLLAVFVGCLLFIVVSFVQEYNEIGG
jgi:hypothetical protein